MEIWDAYNRNKELVGEELIRGGDIKEGYFHMVCEVLVKHIDGSYLLMKRSYDKQNYSGYYEATAGGSALKGENEFDCIKRELREETGIDSDKFEKLGCKIYDEDNCFMNSFICTTSCDKKSICCQKGETIGYKWISQDNFIKYMKSDKAIKRQIVRLNSYLKIT